jgi:hypothetical protein
MEPLKITAGESIGDIIKKISEADDEKVSIVIDEASPLLHNPLNLKILEKIAAENGKELEFGQVNALGAVTEVKEEVLEENLGFVEENSDLSVEKEAETLAEKIDENHVPQESETLSLVPEEVVPSAPTTPQFGIETAAATEVPVVAAGATTLPEEAAPKSGFLPISGFKLPTINLKTLRNIKWDRKRLLLVGGIAGFLLVFFALFYVLPSAEVKLYVSTQDLEKQATVTATPRLNEIDVPSSSIPLTTVEVKESGSQSTKVFGKKNIGEQAKGKVRLRNYSTAQEKSLPKGTNLRVVGKSPVLEFTLDRAAIIPTATSSAVQNGDQVGVITDPGKVEIEVTAAKFGTEANITSATRLAVGSESLSIVDAISIVDFSGGSSKEVTVVSAADRANLLATLSAQLTEKAKEQINSKLSEGQKLPEGGIETEEVKKIYSKDIDQEASDLNLNLEIVAKANVYNEKDLAKLLSESLKGDVSDGFKIDEEQTEATAEVLKVNDDKTVTLLSRVKGKLIPDLDNNELTSNLKGKSIEAAKEYLQTLDNIDDMEINLQPQLLNFLKAFPSNPKRIKIEIISKE